MNRKIIVLQVVLIVLIVAQLNAFAQQSFSLTKYLLENPKVEVALHYKYADDTIIIENLVRDLIETKNISFPDLYSSNLTPDPSTWATYQESTLWNVYYAYAAFSVYMDYSNRLPWKLSEFNQEELLAYFHYNQFFPWHDNSNGFNSESTPTNPVTTYSFLIDNNLIGKNRQETIGRVLQWCRYKLSHTGYISNMYDYWQFNGSPPVERIINGTKFTDTGEFSHWTGGCHATSYFLRNVFRVVNIPVDVKYAEYDLHTGIYFPTEQLHMFHGDQPYGTSKYFSDIEIPISESLISKAEFDSMQLVGFSGIETCNYTDGKLISKHFPLWFFSTDSASTANAVGQQVQNFTRSDTSAAYHEIMQRSALRYSIVDVDRYNEILNLYNTDTLWYKKVYGLKNTASIDTVLIPFQLGAAMIVEDTITFLVDDTVNYVSPFFFHAENSNLSISKGSLIDLNVHDSIIVMAEDSINYRTYYFKKHDIPQYTISTGVFPESTGIANGAGTYNYGITAQVKAIPAAGYQFESWTEDNNIVSVDSAYNFTITNNRTLIANFAARNFTVFAGFNILEGGSVTGSGIYSFGSTATVTAIPETGYSFINWTEDGVVVSTNATYSFVVSNDRSLVANFGIPCYIAASTNPESGGTTTGDGEYYYGTVAELTAIPATGYNFVNWTENGTEVSVNTVYGFTVDGDRNFTANFELQRFSILADPNPLFGGSITGTKWYDYGEIAELIATPEAGYNFINWTEDGIEVSTNSTYTFTVENTRNNLIANFEQQTQIYTISTNPNPVNSGTINGAGTYNSGSLAELTAIPATGYNFVNWTEDGNEGWYWILADYSFYVDRNRSLVANFEKQSFSIYAEPNISIWGEVSGARWYDYGEIAELIAIPAVGYNFINWTEDGNEVSTNSTYTFIVEGTRNNLIANFAIQTYTVSANPNPANAGTIIGAGTHNNGSTAELTAIPATGYNFVNWTENSVEVSTNATYSFTVNGDRSLDANFTLQSFTISANSNPEIGGTVTGSDIYNYGSTAELIATPASGYIFVNWTENSVEVSTNATYSFTVDGDRNLDANFALQSFTISANPNPVNSGTINGTGTYNSGSTAELTATPASGYNFVNWTENGTEVSANTVYDFTVDGDRSLVANFAVINSILDLDHSHYFTLYPNPTNGLVNIQLNESVKDNQQNIQFHLIDLHGIKTKVKSSKISLDLIQIDVTHYPAGIYYLQIIIDNKPLSASKLILSN